jgi:hypothetical protein
MQVATPRSGQLVDDGKNRGKMRTIRDFELKRFFNDEAASAARANISPSFAEPLSTAELLAFEPDAAVQLTRLPLSYTGLDGGLEPVMDFARRG